MVKIKAVVIRRAYRALFLNANDSHVEKNGGMLCSMRRTAKESVTELLRKKGLRATEQRKALLSVLQQAATPLSVEALVGKSGVPIDLATAYRALQEFERLELVQRVLSPNGRALFEVVGVHHHHLTCRTCGAVEDVDVCLPDTFSKALATRSKGFAQIEEHALEFFGTCRSCYASA